MMNPEERALLLAVAAMLVKRVATPAYLTKDENALLDRCSPSLFGQCDYERLIPLIRKVAEQ